MHEHKAPEEPVHVHVAPVSQPVVEQEEEKPVETEIKTNVESEVGVAHHSEHHEHAAPVEERVPEVISDAKELEKVEEIVQHGTTEHLHSAKAHEHNDTLTSSIQSNWENVEHNQVVVENPHVHAVVESEGKGIVTFSSGIIDLNVFNRLLMLVLYKKAGTLLETSQATLKLKKKPLNKVIATSLV